MPKKTRVPDSLLSLARLQGGLVTRKQARAHGISNLVIRGLVADGTWTPRFGCFTVTDHERGKDWQDAWALGLRLGPLTIVTGPTAFRLRNRKISCNAVIAVVPTNVNTQVEGATLLRDTADRRTTSGPGFRIADPNDAFVDTLMCVDDITAQRLVDESLQLHHMSPEALAKVVDARSGRRGVKRLRPIARIAAAGTRSYGERELASLLRSAGLRGWLANFRLEVGGRIVAELDFARPDLMICIEVDGRAFHIDDATFQRDRARQNELAALGWLVLRFTWEQITRNPTTVVAQILAAIAHRQSTFAVG